MPAGFQYYSSAASKLEIGHAFLWKGKSYIAKTVKVLGGEVYLSAEEFDRDNGDDLGMVQLRLNSASRVKIQRLALGF